MIIETRVGTRAPADGAPALRGSDPGRAICWWLVWRVGRRAELALPIVEALPADTGMAFIVCESAPDRDPTWRKQGASQGLVPLGCRTRPHFRR